MHKNTDITRDNALSGQFNTHIADYLLIENTALRPADVGLVFGCWRICDQLAGHAADLYHKGFLKKIIASGGVEDENATMEAHSIARHLRQHGVDNNDILIEDQATHSGENVRFAKALAEKSGLDCASVIGIGHIVAARRFLMTMATHWPEATPMLVSVNPFTHSPQRWTDNPVFRKSVVSECDKYDKYTDRGLIRPVDLKALNARIYALPGKQDTPCPVS